MRRALEIGVAVLLLGLVARTWLVEGVIDPLVVSGGSMAPALMGEHLMVTCRDCEFRFACGKESQPASGTVVCPNCGASSDLQGATVLRGDRVLIDRTSYAAGRPERWDIVVLHTPDDPRSLGVKRIIGLPGETVEIRGGDVYIDARPARRTLRQLLAMAIPVHDARHRPQSLRETRPRREGQAHFAPTTPQNEPVPDGSGIGVKSEGSLRWQPQQTDSRWRPLATGFEWQADQPQQHVEAGALGQPDIDWLVYEHEQAVERGGIHCRPGPILDDLAYNQNESRELVTVPDVLLRCRLQCSTPGVLWLRSNDGRQEFVIRLDACSGRGELTSGQQPLAQISAGPTPLARSSELVLAVADAQLRLTLGGRLLAEHAYDPPRADCHPPARPLAIGSQGLAVQVSELVVLRDVYYLAVNRSNGVVFRQLGADEYWLLGDNCAASIDSRTWPPVYANSLVGKVLVYR